MKNKTAATLLAFFLGSFGAHKFYLGKTFTGILYFLFCWTAIPGFIAFFESILLLVMSEDNFNVTYNSRYLLMANQLQSKAISEPKESIAEQLEDLNELHVKGAITDKEFARLKAKLIA
ncbi:MAG: hypothetical protein COB02_02625 [Candidatus Cloacimonadota bacterium]|nr:MAG: hypothetical protein COB02_02625 [Candidatus Cloacimonadota bacterium]